MRRTHTGNEELITQNVEWIVTRDDVRGRERGRDFHVKGRILSHEWFMSERFLWRDGAELHSVHSTFYRGTRYQKEEKNLFMHVRVMLSKLFVVSKIFLLSLLNPFLLLLSPASGYLITQNYVTTTNVWLFSLMLQYLYKHTSKRISAQVAGELNLTFLELLRLINFGFRSFLSLLFGMENLDHSPQIVWHLE